MCIDNFSISHGRQPTYDLGRKILVAWSTPLNKRPFQLQCIEEETAEKEIGVTKDYSDAILDDKLVPGVMESPDCTPNSTLTKEESEDLRDSFALSMANETIACDDSFVRYSVGVSHKRSKSCPVQQIHELFASKAF